MPEKIRLAQRVDAQLAGVRVDQAAAALFPDFSRARLQAWIRQGSLTVDGNTVRPAFRVTGGERLCLKADLEPQDRVLPEDLELDVLAVDEHLLVLNKAAGLVVHPAAGNPAGTLQNGLLHYDPGLACIPRAGIVHRLDKDTSGIMVVARSLKAHAALVGQLHARSMSRLYQAVVSGLAPGEGRVDAAIGRDPHNRQRMAVVPSGKPAVSRYRVLRHFRHFSHLEVALESGRTHQIRVHMQHIGLPLVGDAVYGRSPRKRKDMPGEVYDAARGFPRQALHARTLRLIHPDSGRQLEFSAPLPADLSALLDVLGRHDA